MSESESRIGPNLGNVFLLISYLILICSFSIAISPVPEDLSSLELWGLGDCWHYIAHVVQHSWSFMVLQIILFWLITIAVNKKERHPNRKTPGNHGGLSLDFSLSVLAIAFGPLYFLSYYKIKPQMEDSWTSFQITLLILDYLALPIILFVLGGGLALLVHTLENRHIRIGSRSILFSQILAFTYYSLWTMSAMLLFNSFVPARTSDLVSLEKIMLTEYWHLPIIMWAPVFSLRIIGRLSGSSLAKNAKIEPMSNVRIAAHFAHDLLYLWPYGILLLGALDHQSPLDIIPISISEDYGVLILFLLTPMAITLPFAIWRLRRVLTLLRQQKDLMHDC